MQINSSYREEDSRQFGHVSREFGTHTAPGSADGLSSQYDAREWTGLKGQPQIGVPEGGQHHTRAARSAGPGSGAGERGTGPENALEPPATGRSLEPGQVGRLLLPHREAQRG